LLGELDGDREWMAYLARALADGSLAVLVLERAGGAAFDMRIVSELDATPRPIGRTRCGWCAVEMDGWPRVCDGCGRDLSGLAPEVAFPGSSAADLLDGVRAAAEEEEEGYDVLGAMGAAKGGGALYFARERAAGRIVGLVLRQGEDGSELSLDPSWSQDEVALASPAIPEDAPQDELGDEHGSEPHGTTEEELAPGDENPKERHDGFTPVPRRVRRGAFAVAAAIVASIATLAFLLWSRADSRIEDGLAIVLPPFVPTNALSAGPGEVARFGKSAPDTVRIAPTRPNRGTPPTRTDSVVPDSSPPDSVVAEEKPSAEVDRKYIIAALEQYVGGLRTRRVEEMQDAYPGMPNQDVRRWRNFFGKIRGFSLLVTDEIQEPAIDGDAASVVFQVRLDYNGRRETLRSRATLERTGNGWVIRAINGP
jgi:hypothetical protein